MHAILYNSKDDFENKSILNMSKYNDLLFKDLKSSFICFSWQLALKIKYLDPFMTIQDSDLSTL